MALCPFGHMSGAGLSWAGAGPHSDGLCHPGADSGPSRPTPFFDASAGLQTRRPLTCRPSANGSGAPRQELPPSHPRPVGAPK